MDEQCRLWKRFDASLAYILTQRVFEEEPLINTHIKGLPSEVCSQRFGWLSVLMNGYAPTSR